MRLSAKSRRIGAYLLVAISSMVGVYGLDMSARSQARNTSAVTLKVCDGQNQVRIAIVSLVSKNAGPTPIPVGADAALRQVIENSNHRSDVFLQELKTELAPLDCKALAKKVGP